MHEVKLVGILNRTPDSFSDGGMYVSTPEALFKADQMFEEGSSFIDVGGESTRPGAEVVSEDEEWRRLEPVLGALIEKYPGRISLDSYKPETVRRAATLGEFIINDVTGFNNWEMVAVAAETGFPFIVSHFPEACYLDIQFAHELQPIVSADQVLHELMNVAQQLQYIGVDMSKCIMDPGLGFGKTRNANWELLSFAELMVMYPVMIGHSRKRFLGENRTKPETNVEAASIAVAAGAQYLRVHDVAAHRTLIGA